MGSRESSGLAGVARFLVLAVVLVAAVVAGGMYAVSDWLPSLNPFHEETIDRTGPSVLESLTDLSDYQAASAHYETVVDIEEDTKFLPSFISGERVLYVAKGDVAGEVDFGELDERRVEVSEDGTTATITLPAPTIGQPVLDLENSYVANHDEGFADVFKGSDLERDAQLKALEQMTSAATGEGELTDLAKENTTTMLRGLLGALGYTDITVDFDENPL